MPYYCFLNVLVFILVGRATVAFRVTKSVFDFLHLQRRECFYNCNTEILDHLSWNSWEQFLLDLFHSLETSFTEIKASLQTVKSYLVYSSFEMPSFVPSLNKFSFSLEVITATIFHLSAISLIYSWYSYPSLTFAVGNFNFNRRNIFPFSY